jgi:hypothetical protein
MNGLRLGLKPFADRFKHLALLGRVTRLTPRRGVVAGALFCILNSRFCIPAA